VLRTDNLAGRRCWQMIDYPLTRPARFLKLLTRWCGDFGDSNDSKDDCVYRLSAGKST
jgi:hypothetical protein